jgi:hypothetical protein
MSFPQPPKGSMFLYDYITPPLPTDKYRIEVDTRLSLQRPGASTREEQLLNEARYFEVVGPRFQLSPADVAGVYPPRNGHGAFQDSLAQIVIKRRTLPWERPLDKANHIGDPTGSENLPADYPVPWVALLIFEEDEYTLLQNVPLENVVSTDVFARLGRPLNILCDAVEASLPLVRSIIPSKEELQLLAHVRQVNIDDRELSVEGSEGWFAVVMANRVPTVGAKCRACLVSLEERSDLVPRDPPPVFVPTGEPPLTDFPFRDVTVLAKNRSRVTEKSVDIDYGRLIPANVTHSEVGQPGLVFSPILDLKTRLVLLHSWQFICEGNCTFFDLMQGLDVGMIGKTKTQGQPALTDTAHLHMKLQDRGGTEETTWYRGPLVPFDLTPDPLGPYHSADQARRATPETGAEDISYAAAFDLGRLLAAADARFAQELMRWRRESFKQRGRVDTIEKLRLAIDFDLPSSVADQIYAALIPSLATSVVESIVDGIGPIGDPYGIDVASRAAGFDPAALQTALGLDSIDQARAMLGADPGSLGVESVAPPLTERENVTLEIVAGSSASLEILTEARQRIHENTQFGLDHQTRG